MTNDTNKGPILRTKLHRPPAPRDYVHRPRLLEYLDQQRKQPLTLVSAPAGYGKSTLMSCWLGSCDSPSAWLSLDENDNDLRQFLAYFIAAVETIFPDAVSKTMTLVDAPTLPTLSTMVGSLCNELDAIEQDFILVLDDIHCIQEKSVHHFLSDLLRHPPRPMHLVLIGRRDPMVNIATLRARSQLAEIRLQDLRFTATETAAYLRQILKQQIDEDITVAWTQNTEGWVTGLRLAALSFQHRADFKTIPPEPQGGTQYVMEYLFNEILSHQPPGIRDYLLKTSILDRFCAPLCDAIFSADVEPGNAQNGARQFIALLKNENLFLINLDAEDQWFRYHHLFKDLLNRQLRRHYPPNDIKMLHSQASEWFESKGLITESIKHALVAEDAVRAAEIVERYRHDEVVQDKWFVVGNWLNLLPPEIILQRPGLLLAQAWLRFNQFRLLEIPPLLERVNLLLTDENVAESLLGELDFHWGYLAIWLEGDAEAALKRLQSARNRLPETHRELIAETEFDLALARQMIGDGASTIEYLEKRIQTTLPPDFMMLTRWVGAQVFIYLMSGDLKCALPAAQRLGSFGKEGGNVHLLTWAEYLQALALYQSNRLDEALQGFLFAAEKRDICHRKVAVDALAGLVLTYHAMQRTDDAVDTLKLFMKFARGTADPENVAVAESCRARLALMLGDLKSAISWAQSFDAEPHAPSTLFWLEVPFITKTKIQIAEGTRESLEKAIESVESLRQDGAALHLTCLTIEILVLKSLAMEKLGSTNDAQEALEEALSLAKPGGWIRPFVEAGSPMVDLLMRLHKQNISVDYIDKLLAAFPEPESPPPLPDLGATNDEREFEVETVTPIQNPKSKIQNSLIEPLTNRELDVLELLAQRLQNKEIAEKLFISSATVKSHLESIYQKLNVSKRREAVEKAKKIGIF